MRVGEVYELLDSISPFELQESWDNSGLLLGEFSQDVKRVVLSVDIDANMVQEAQEHTLFVLHHPLIFSGLKSLRWDEYPANILRDMVKKDHSVIAMHTNFDKTHLNRYVFEKVLGFKAKKCEEFICYAEGRWQSKELLENIKRALSLDVMRVVGSKSEIRSVAMVTGAGASLMDLADADLFLTGDIKFHDAMKGVSKGVMMADIGHFESERHFADALGENLKNLPIPVIIAQSINPFTYI